MITYQQAIKEQEDIEQLCAAKTPSNFEVYAPNNNYGFASILKAYSGYPRNKAIMGVIPHAIYLHDAGIFPGELNCSLPAVLNYPEFRSTIWKKLAKKKQIIPSASPFLYALRLFKPEVKEKEKKGTLYFPPHSTALVTMSFNQELLIKQLNDLPEHLKPITVCVHWHDVTLNLHQFFQSHGFKVVSAGHMYDENFIFRWLHLVSAFKYTMGGNVSSPLFYSVSAGTPHFLIDSQFEYEEHESFQAYSTQNNPYSKRASFRLKRIWQLFSAFTETITEEQKELVNYCMGYAYRKKSDALLKQLQLIQSETV